MLLSNFHIWQRGILSKCDGTTVTKSEWGENMGKRITIMIDEDLERKLRLLQAKNIASTKQGVSFSQVLNKTLRRAIK